MAELSLEKAILGKILSAPYTFESAVENGLKEKQMRSDRHYCFPVDKIDKKSIK